MASIPLWLWVLRLYGHYSPFHRGKTRLVAWTYRHLSVPPLLVKAQLDGTLSVSLHLDVWVDYNVYCRGIYEYYTSLFFKGRLRTDSVFFDVGSYIGQYALLAARVATRGKTYAFEPHPQSVNRLTDHIRDNRLTNVEIVPMGVGAVESRLPFYLAKQPFQSSLVESHAGYQEVQEIPIISLDAFCAERRIERVDIVKIDVEEAEDDVIEGAMSILKIMRPLVILEVGGKSIKDGLTSLERLTSLDYELCVLNRTRLRPLPTKLTPGRQVIAMPPDNVPRL